MLDNKADAVLCERRRIFSWCDDGVEKMIFRANG